MSGTSRSVAISPRFRQLLLPTPYETTELVARHTVVFGCAKVISVERIPEIALGEPTFFPTIEAHTGATIAGGNRVEILLNGDETFPVMLRDIKAAKSTITFAQYLYE